MQMQITCQILNFQKVISFVFGNTSMHTANYLIVLYRYFCGCFSPRMGNAVEVEFVMVSWSPNHPRHHPSEGPGQGAWSDEVAVPCVRSSKNKRSSTRGFRMSLVSYRYHGPCPCPFVEPKNKKKKYIYLPNTKYFSIFYALKRE